MRTIDTIVIHHSASKWGNVEAIRHWHTDKPPAGNGWCDIGYHFLICNGRPQYGMEYLADDDGWLEVGRPVAEQGAHCHAVNARSIGICCVGLAEPTARQLVTLYKLIKKLKSEYTIIDIGGHRDYAATDCPGWDVRKWVADGARSGYCMPA